MKISIITVTYNSATTIQDTLESVQSQNYNDIEHIIIDGASMDKTLEIISQFTHVSKIVSEPDKGIYDAMNKGIELTKGDIIGILNSDDLFYDSNTIDCVAEIFKNNDDIDAVYGNMNYFETKNPEKKIRFWKSIPFYQFFFEDGYIIPHPTLFVRKKVYDETGLYYPNFKLGSDYEFMLRAFKIYNFKPYYLNKTLVKMRMGGESTKNWRNIFLGNVEIYKSWKMNKLPIPKLFYINRFIYKVKQYI